MNKKEVKQLLLNVVDEHITERFKLDDTFRITNFKAKNLSITMENTNYAVTVSCKGIVEEELLAKVLEKEEELRIEE